MFYYTLLFLRGEETEKRGLENTFLIEKKFFKARSNLLFKCVGMALESNTYSTLCNILMSMLQILMSAGASALLSRCPQEC